MASKIPQTNFAEVFIPEHPHRRMHILLSILAFAVVIGSITAYQINKTKEEKPIEDINTEEYKIRKLTEISESLQVQEQTPEFKKKLEAMSKSLNK